MTAGRLPADRGGDVPADDAGRAGNAPQAGSARPARAEDPAALEAEWASRVRANREQAERFRETQGGDFYAPVSSLFVADPRRTGEPALEVLFEQAGSNERWLDIGAGAGRYALPLALRVREVIAVEPSPSMRRALRTGMGEHGIGNVRVVPAAWPQGLDELGDLPAADVSLIAHVGYDIEDIGPFVDAMEAATEHRCVAILTDRSPASVADPFWPLVHGEARVPLPALPELLALLLARGRDPLVTVVERSPRAFESVAALTAFLRRQLFIAEGGEKDVHFRAILPDHITRRDGAWTLTDPPQGSLGVVTWGVGG
jgi:SAM-dependent methyltransferase